MKKMKVMGRGMKYFSIALGVAVASTIFADADQGVNESIRTSLSRGGDSQMAVITTTKTTLNVKNLPADGRLFAGQPAGCVKGSGPNEAHCCATEGWGQDPTLNVCTNSEKALAVARNAGLATYVGDSCIQDSRGNCMAPISVYCVFPNQISHQVQEEGRYQQLGVNFGTPSQPDCSGLTINQIQKIDLTEIDFEGSENVPMTSS